MEEQSVTLQNDKLQQNYDLYIAHTRRHTHIHTFINSRFTVFKGFPTHTHAHMHTHTHAHTEVQ